MSTGPGGYRVVFQEAGGPAVASEPQQLTSALSMFQHLVAAGGFDPRSGRSLRILTEHDWAGRVRAAAQCRPEHAARRTTAEAGRSNS